MANETLTLDRLPASALIPRWMIETAFVGFLLLVFVGLTPFQVVPLSTATRVLSSGGGDMLRQVLYVGLFGFLAIVAMERRSLGAFAIVPLSLVLLLVWCFASAAWSVVPGITLRRAGLELIVVSCAMLGVDAVGPRRCFELLRYVLIAVLVVNWISIPLLPQARHMAIDSIPSLVGDWRGLYFQKNIAGAVCALTAIIELYYAIHRRSWLDGVLFVAAIGFAIGTRSKTSLGLLPVALALGGIYGWGWRRDLDRLIAILAALLLVVIGAAVLLANTSVIAHKLNNPTDFTGRSAIWKAEAGYIADHPVLGAGYGTFADTGAPSPLAPYVNNAWVEQVSHGHNGYLQLLVTTGTVGFLLAMVALILLPFLRFWRRQPDEDLGFKALLFALFMFVVLHNLLETDYLEGDGGIWVMLLFVIAMLHRLPKRPTASMVEDAGQCRPA